MLADCRTLLDPVLRGAIDTLPTSMRRITGYHFGWWDERGNDAESGGGKAFRPAVVLLAAAAVGGTPAAAVPAATAVELVHNFSLLHDDVMDGDHTRHHRPTVWRVFGIGPAILAGDALLTLALEVLAASATSAAQEGMQMLGTAVQDLVEGQSADVDFEQRDDVGLADCERMSARKTGALLGCAGGIGALFGGADPVRIGHLRAFGAHLGMAFQHADDLLGIWGDPAVTGKPIHSDLYNRKKSLPVVAALTSGTPAGHALAALYHADEPLSDAEVARAAELVDRAGGRAWSHAQADLQLGKAMRELAAAEPDAHAAAELGELARHATRRDH